MNFFVAQSLYLPKGVTLVNVADCVIEQFIEGDMEAMSTLVESYKTELYNFCFRLTWSKPDAEDLFQQTWVKAVKSAPKFHNEAFRAWLYKICLNQFRDNRKETERRRRHIAEEFGSTSAKEYVMASAAKGESAEEQFEKKHIQGLIVANIDKLPEKLKVPMVLFFYQRMKYADIALVMRVPEGTVKSRISAAKKRLKTVLEGELYV